MSNNIDSSIRSVNRSLYLNANRFGYSFAPMKYGERLRLAREKAELTQQELAERVGMKQPSLAYLENPAKNAKGSEFTVKLSRVLGVSVDWLDDEIGEMISTKTGQQYTDPRIEHVCRVMQSLPPYAVDAGVREIDSLAELIQQIPKPDGPARPPLQNLSTAAPSNPGGGLPYSYKQGDMGRAKAVPADKKKQGGKQ